MNLFVDLSLLMCSFDPMAENLVPLVGVVVTHRSLRPELFVVYVVAGSV